MRVRSTQNRPRTVYQTVCSKPKTKVTASFCLHQYKPNTACFPAFERTLTEMEKINRQRKPIKAKNMTTLCLHTAPFNVLHTVNKQTTAETKIEDTSELWILPEAFDENLLRVDNTWTSLTHSEHSDLQVHENVHSRTAGVLLLALAWWVQQPTCLLCEGSVFS